MADGPCDAKACRRPHLELLWLSEDRDVRRIFASINYGVCWIPPRWFKKSGYSLLYFRGKNRLGHRLVWEFLVGEVPGGLDLDHLCRDRRCVNPDHLEPVTRSVNCRRGNTGLHLKIKTHCPHGHPYNKKNTYVRLNDKGRSCRVCSRQAQQRLRDKRKAEQ